MEDTRSEIVKVTLPEGAMFQVEARVQPGEEEVAFRPLSFAGVTEALEGIATALSSSLKRVRPRRATVEFGVELAVESGALTALVVKGSGTANLTITLEWESQQVEQA